VREHTISVHPKHPTLGTEPAPEGKLLVNEFEFGGSFGMSLEGDFHELEVTPNLELLVTFVMTLEGICYELYT
jgi:hypothetical protein